MSVLEKMRSRPEFMKGGEVQSIASDEGIAELFDDIQKLKAELFQAKKVAADLAAKPYLEAIEEAEKEYAMLIRLRS